MPQSDDPFAAYLQRLERPISSARLNRYRPDDSTDRDVLINYFWNITLCEALYPALDALEVSLRNSVHVAATFVYGTENWFDLPGVLLGQRNHPEVIATARATLSAYGRPDTAGRIIAELSFGFWASLLTGHYEQHLWRPANYRLLREAFPHMPPRIRSRKNVHDRYNAIRLLRNRVFHFEPIMDRPELLREHWEIIEAISWISPDLRDAVLLFNRFPDVYSSGRRRIERELATWLDPQ